MSDAELERHAGADPALTYGAKRETNDVAQFVPAHVAFDGLVLSFSAYFEETIPESPDETLRVRRVFINFFLEVGFRCCNARSSPCRANFGPRLLTPGHCFLCKDQSLRLFFSPPLLPLVSPFRQDDTISVVEPRVENSGLDQGTLVKRQLIPRGGSGGGASNAASGSVLPGTGAAGAPDYLDMFDLNVGEEVTIFGRHYHAVDCDAFTRRYLEQNGVVVGDPQPFPADQYAAKRAAASTTARLYADNTGAQRRCWFATRGFFVSFSFILV